MIRFYFDMIFIKVFTQEATDEGALAREQAPWPAVPRLEDPDGEKGLEKRGRATFPV
jgi:hypothetical protein